MTDQILGAVLELKADLGRVEGKLDEISQRQVEGHARIDKIETSQAHQKGIVAAVSSLVSVAVTGIGMWITHRGNG